MTSTLIRPFLDLEVGDCQDIVSLFLCSIFVRGSFSAEVLRSSLASVHKELVHHLLEDEVDGQEEGQDDKREDGEQREERGVIEKSQTKNMSA